MSNGTKTGATEAARTIPSGCAGTALIYWRRHSTHQSSISPPQLLGVEEVIFSMVAIGKLIGKDNPASQKLANRLHGAGWRRAKLGPPRETHGIAVGSLLLHAK